MKTQPFHHACTIGTTPQLCYLRNVAVTSNSQENCCLWLFRTWPVLACFQHSVQPSDPRGEGGTRRRGILIAKYIKIFQLKAFSNLVPEIEGSLDPECSPGAQSEKPPACQALGSLKTFFPKHFHLQAIPARHAILEQDRVS